jgi:hypothetical protein
LADLVSRAAELGSVLGFGGWFRCGLADLFRLVLGRELLFDLEGDGVGVHPVRLSCIAENLRGIVARRGQKDDSFDQNRAQRAFIGTAEEGNKQFLDSVSVLDLLDAMLPGKSLRDWHRNMRSANCIAGHFLTTCTIPGPTSCPTVSCSSRGPAESRDALIHSNRPMHLRSCRHNFEYCRSSWYSPVLIRRPRSLLNSHFGRNRGQRATP